MLLRCFKLELLNRAYTYLQLFLVVTISCRFHRMYRNSFPYLLAFECRRGGVFDRRSKGSGGFEAKIGRFIAVLFP